MLHSLALFLVPELSQNGSARLRDLSSEMLPASPSSLKAALTGLDPTPGLKSSNHSTLRQTQLTTISHKVFFAISALYKPMAILKYDFISQFQAFNKYLVPLLVLLFLFCFIFPILKFLFVCMTYHLQSLDPHCSYNSIFIPTDFMSFKINLTKFFVTSILWKLKKYYFNFLPYLISSTLQTEPYITLKCTNVITFLLIYLFGKIIIFRHGCLSTSTKTYFSFVFQRAPYRSASIQSWGGQRSGISIYYFYYLGVSIGIKAVCKK